MIVIGATVLGIALLGDYPKRDERRGLNARYTAVKGHLGPAFKTELAGAALLVLAPGRAASPRAAAGAGAALTPPPRARGHGDDRHLDPSSAPMTHSNAPVAAHRA